MHNIAWTNTQADQKRRSLKATPEYEDAGLFRSQIVEVDLDLVSQVARNSRGDVVILGLVSGDRHVDVVFAGRRMQGALPLADLVRKRAASFRGHHVDIGGDHWPGSVRVPVTIKGAWRARFTQDSSGWETRRYQLLVATCQVRLPGVGWPVIGEVPTQSARSVG